MRVCKRMLTYGSYLLGVKAFNLQQLLNQAYEQYLGFSTILKNVKKPKSYLCKQNHFHVYNFKMDEPRDAK